MKYLLSYTRKPIDNVYYDPKLAFSMHLAIADESGVFTALNHNSGILFAKATEEEDGSLTAHCLDRPHIVKLEQDNKDEFFVYAYRTGADGEEESPRRVLCYRTKNFVEYELVEELDEDEDLNLLLGERPDRTDDPDGEVSASLSEADFSGIEGIIPWSVIEIDEGIYDYLSRKLLPCKCVSVEGPKEYSAGSERELEGCLFTAYYSDGTTEKKRVSWDVTGIDFKSREAQEIKGRISRPHFAFPVATSRADPCIGFYNDKFYFIATNDADNNHSLYIREARTVEGLVNAREHLILDTETYPDIKGLLWAPEFHMVGDKFCIYHAATPGHFFEEESCVMILKEGGNPTVASDWSKPVRMVKPDGSYLCEAGKEITLDMTVFSFNRKYYAVWSERQFLPKDLGAWLYIAELDANDPHRLASEPVVLSKPDYSWANNHTFVEEGPFALLYGGKLILTYSAAAVDTSYVVGMLSIECGLDPLDISNWKKRGFPLLTSRSVEGEFGTGHNAYCLDEYGNIWNSYHARPGVDAPRSSGIRRVHFDFEGEPVLDMTEEMDVPESMLEVKVTLTGSSKVYV